MALHSEDQRDRRAVKLNDNNRCKKRNFQLKKVVLVSYFRSDPNICPLHPLISPPSYMVELVRLWSFNHSKKVCTAHAAWGLTVREISNQRKFWFAISAMYVKYIQSSAYDKDHQSYLRPVIRFLLNFIENNGVRCTLHSGLAFWTWNDLNLKLKKWNKSTVANPNRVNLSSTAPHFQLRFSVKWSFCDN